MDACFSFGDLFSACPDILMSLVSERMTRGTFPFYSMLLFDES
jgi:hypothetical protein